MGTNDPLPMLKDTHRIGNTSSPQLFLPSPVEWCFDLHNSVLSSPAIFKEEAFHLYRPA